VVHAIGKINHHQTKADLTTHAAYATTDGIFRIQSSDEISFLVVNAIRAHSSGERVVGNGQKTQRSQTGQQARLSPSEIKTSLANRDIST
jgi:hypothetical protein